MTQAICWKCGNDITQELTAGKVPFRAVCHRCLSGLHSCFGCMHYKRGAPNDCEVPDVELVKNKDMPNFCEEFKPRFALREKLGPSASDISKKLFGD